MSTLAFLVPLAVADAAGGAQKVIAAVLALGLLIAFHEFGHFLVAKLLGIGVQKFSLGFGPTIVGKKIGETEYVLAWIPLGGFVKMVGENLGDDVTPEERARSFLARPPLHRILVVLAGPLFNLVLAFLLFSGVFYARGEPVEVDAESTKVGGVSPGMPAYDAGLRRGDEVVAIDGERVAGWADMAERIQGTAGKQFVVTAKRGEQMLDFRVQALGWETKQGWLSGLITRVVRWFQDEPAAAPEPTPKTIYRIGIEGSPTYKKLGPLESVKAGFEETVAFSIAIPVMLASIFEGNVSMRDVAGPLGIAKMAGQQVEQGLALYAHFVGILSVNLGIFNLLPIPILDGGQLLLFLVEWIRRRPLSLSKQELIQQVGFYLLIGIMALAIFNDFYNQLRAGRRASEQGRPSTIQIQERAGPAAEQAPP